MELINRIAEVEERLRLLDMYELELTLMISNKNQESMDNKLDILNAILEEIE